MNEIKDNSPSSIVQVIGSSIGLAGCIYIVVSITGYITFGNAIVANIVSMCKFGGVRNRLNPTNYEEIPPVLLPQSAKLRLSSSYCSQSLCKFILAGHL